MKNIEGHSSQSRGARLDPCPLCHPHGIKHRYNGHQPNTPHTACCNSSHLSHCKFEMTTVATFQEGGGELEVTFRPPLFLQRRGWVFDILRREGISQVGTSFDDLNDAGFTVNIGTGVRCRVWRRIHYLMSLQSCAVASTTTTIDPRNLR